MAARGASFRTNDGRRLARCVTLAVALHALLAIFLAGRARRDAFPKTELHAIELVEAFAPGNRAPSQPPARSVTAADPATSARSARRSKWTKQTHASVAAAASGAQHTAPVAAAAKPQYGAEAAGQSAHGAAVSASPPALLGGGSRPGARAVLIAQTAACDGLFPHTAASDGGVVTLSMQVTPHGRAHASRIVDEQPRGEGFGAAARRCLERIRFQPARSAQGLAIESTSVLRLRFARHLGARRTLSAAATRVSSTPRAAAHVTAAFATGRLGR